MKALTANQMREADRRCIEDVGIPSVVLMNTAGTRVFEHVNRGPVGIVCGRGNNGGDGFVVARLALLAGFEPRVVVIGELDSLKGDPALFFKAYRNLGGRAVVARSETDALREVGALRDCAVLVDALLGTGITGEVRGPVRAAIDTWPEVYTIAVDLPSGLDADTGEVLGNCVRADITVTFQYPKLGLVMPEAKRYIGRLVVADIGIPTMCADDEAWFEFERARQGG
ncbi:MAG TPA: NAD(P)H-hydrate epimerase [Candidatus Hydrogenedentes bacterium]|nr:NAD(P)H-hydrate epimerase [Candidatus Hydrogenedentota bacterium]HPK00387.1 NAD(P)H-hydrate epimerase [Candidatus Hydrogenedentota bacterium]